jgi:hypothetical protein
MVPPSSGTMLKLWCYLCCGGLVLTFGADSWDAIRGRLLQSQVPIHGRVPRSSPKVSVFVHPVAVDRV